MKTTDKHAFNLMVFPWKILKRSKLKYDLLESTSCFHEFLTRLAKNLISVVVITLLDSGKIRENQQILNTEKGFPSFYDYQKIKSENGKFVLYYVCFKFKAHF
jgi:hypothetical protein